MANWANPTITSNYVNFVDEVKNRDLDAIQLQASPLTNPPYASIALVRSPVKFQEYRGSPTGFVDLVLSPAGGGTGVTNIPALVPQLGLGTMAVQNANAVSISGGSLNAVALTNISIVNATLGGNGSYVGTGFQFNSYQGNTPITVTGGTTWSMFINGAVDGLLITGGTTKSHNPLMIRNYDATKYGFFARGDMGIIIPIGLVIPVGQSAFVPA